MSDKKRARRRKDEYTEPGEQKVDKPSKDEITIATWLKKNVKTKKTKFLSHNVEYFTSSKAIDALLKSKFAEGDKALFTTREQVIDFLDVMLEHKFFHRAKKVPLTSDEMRIKGEKVVEKPVAKSDTKSSATTKKDEKKKSAPSSPKESKKETDNEKKDTDAEADAGAESGDGNAAGSDKKEKRKRKIRLDMHPEQIFVDGSEAYVWIYDPIPLHYWVIGFVLLLGAVGICLFPLWPPIFRQGVYYLSILAAGFLVFILALTVVRLIVFTFVWGLTWGKLHFWVFPNLTEDVGFFASFWPLYESKYVTDDEVNKPGKKSKSKSKKKDKDSDAEEEDTVVVDNDGDADGDADGDGDADIDSTPLEPEKIEEIKEHDAEIELRQRKVRLLDGASHSGDEVTELDAKDGVSHSSESESEGSSKDYEFINSSEVQNVN